MHCVFISLAVAALALAQDAPTSGSPHVARVSPETNAKRFALGMPPLKPRPRRYHAGTHVDSAPRAQTSPTPPTQVLCNILATSFDRPFGYLSRKWNEQGQYYAVQPGQDDDALVVSISYTGDDPRQIPLLVTNGPNEAFPYLGGVLHPGSLDDNFGSPPNYAYLAGTTLTTPYSPAVAGPNSYDNNQHMETSIWQFIPPFGAISPQWVNGPDSGYRELPTTHIMYLHDQGKLILTGDPLWVFNNLGRAEILRFKCAPVAV